jgi:hypothetical protein
MKLATTDNNTISYSKSRGNAVGIATGYGLNGRGVGVEIRVVSTI